MSEWAPARARVALLAGQSRSGENALAPVQLAFLEAIAPPEAIVRSGFPFEPAIERVRAPAALLAASISNACQYCAARWDRGFADRAGANLNALLACTQRLVLITGSAGLAMLNAARRRLDGVSSVAVLAFGPAGHAIEDVRFIAVQGERDPWSRALYRGPVHHRIDCAHMGYWESDEARAIARAFVGEALA